MNYEQAAQKVHEFDLAIDKINTEAKKKVSEINKIRNDVINWITLKAQEDGLKTVPTPYGTAYWSVHHSATCGSPDVFKQFVIENSAWDLMEVRAAKLAVKSYVEAHGEPPPGVNFSSRKVFVLTQSPVKE